MARAAVSTPRPHSGATEAARVRPTERRIGKFRGPASVSARMPFPRREGHGPHGRKGREKHVPGTNSRARWPGRRHRRRAVVGRRVPRGAARTGVSSFGSERNGRPGGGVLPHRHAPDPVARADPRAGRADHPGPHPAAPGGRLRRAAQGRLHPHQHLAQLRGPRARRVRGRLPAGAAVHGTRHGIRPEAHRPAAAQRGAARGFAAISGQISLESVARPSARSSRPRSPRPISPRRPRPSRSSPRHSARLPMLKQIEGSAAVAEAVALCRPEVICAYPISPQTHIVEGLGKLVDAGKLSPCESSTSSRSSPRCRSRSAPRRPAPVPIPPPPARGCCSWRRRCSTRRVSACPSS